MEINAFIAYIPLTASKEIIINNTIVANMSERVALDTYTGEAIICSPFSHFTVKDIYEKAIVAIPVKYPNSLIVFRFSEILVMAKCCLVSDLPKPFVEQLNIPYNG